MVLAVRFQNLVSLADAPTGTSAKMKTIKTIALAICPAPRMVSPPGKRWAERSPSCLQPRGVPAQVIRHEGRYEVVAVVIARLAAKQERDAGLRAGTLQQLRAQLLGEERIGIADIDEKIGKPRAVLDQCNGIVLAPGLAGIAEVTGQRLDAPWDLRRRRDRRECAGGAIAVGVSKRCCQRAMSAHRMAQDRLPFSIGREMFGDQLRQFF